MIYLHSDTKLPRLFKYNFKGLNYLFTDSKCHVLSLYHLSSVQAVLFFQLLKRPVINEKTFPQRAHLFPYKLWIYSSCFMK